MKNITIFIMVALLTACATSPPQKLEAITTKGKTPDMKVAFKKDFGPGNGTITEFIPPNEEIESWHHMATIQFIESETRTALEFMRGLEAIMKERCPNTMWSITEETTYGVFYEWSIDSCPGNENQHEIARLIEGNDGLHRFAYTEKRNPMDSDNKRLWSKIIRNAYVAKGDPDSPIVRPNEADLTTK